MPKENVWRHKPITVRELDKTFTYVVLEYLMEESHIIYAGNSLIKAKGCGSVVSVWKESRLIGSLERIGDRWELVLSY